MNMNVAEGRANQSSRMEENGTHQCIEMAA